MDKVYSIPIEWEIMSRANVRANTLEEALGYLREHVNEIEPPSFEEMTNGSYRIVGDNGQEVSDLASYLKSSNWSPSLRNEPVTKTKNGEYLDANIEKYEKTKGAIIDDRTF